MNLRNFEWKASRYVGGVNQYLICIPDDIDIIRCDRIKYLLDTINRVAYWCKPGMDSWHNIQRNAFSSIDDAKKAVMFHYRIHKQPKLLLMR